MKPEAKTQKTEGYGYGDSWKDGDAPSSGGRRPWIKALCVILSAFVAGAAAAVSLKEGPDVAEQETSQTSMNAGWTAFNADGAMREAVLPEKNVNEAVYVKVLPADASGAELSLGFGNAAVSVYIDGMPAASEDGDGSVWKNSDLTDSGDAARTEAKKSAAEAVSGYGEECASPQSGKLTVSVPKKKSTHTVAVKTVPSVPFFPARFKDASISSGGSGTVWTSSAGMCALLLVMAGLSAMFDAVRYVSGGKPAGTCVLSAAASVTALYGILQAGLAGGGTDAAARMALAVLPLTFSLYAMFRGKTSGGSSSMPQMLFSFLCAVAAIGMETAGTWMPLPSKAACAAAAASACMSAASGIAFSYEKTDGRAFGLAGLFCLAASAFSLPAEEVLPVKCGGLFLPLACAGVFLLLARETDAAMAEYRSRAGAAARELKWERDRANEEKKTAEKERERADAADRAKSAFLARMSHEIRTPINAVLGMDEMILRDTGEDQTRERAAKIRSAGKTLLALINDILDFSKIESGKMELVPSDYLLSDVISDLSDMAEARAEQKGLRFVTDVDPGIPSACRGDDVRLKQVVTNILTNAVKYTEKGTVTLKVSAKKSGRDALLRFSVTDTGMGIKKEDLPKLTEAYRRIEEGRNRNTEGTGLGMSITVSLLALMKSRLEVSSEYGRGSVFSFTVRQRTVDPSPVGEAWKKRAVDSAVRGPGFFADEAVVLVVDDNEINREVFAGLLEPTGVQVDMAVSGEEAIEKTRNKRYDAVFMDSMMPGMDGTEAMKRIKADGKNPCRTVPICVLTADAVSGAKEAYLKEGFDGFLSKPVSLDKLEEAVMRCIPEDKLKKAPSPVKEHMTPKKSGADMPPADGVDWDIALLRIPDRNLLLKTAEDFAGSAPAQAGKLHEAYRALPDVNALEAYRIQAHAMKSSSMSVGLVSVSGLAKTLEDAASHGKTDVIKRIHGVFMQEWKDGAVSLAGAAGMKKKKSGKKEAEPEAVKALLKTLLKELSDFDMGGADSTMKKLLSFSYGEKASLTVRELKEAAEAMDSAMAADPAGRLALAADGGMLNA